MFKIIAPIFLALGLVFLGSGLLLAQIEIDEGILSEIRNVTIGDDEIPVITFTLTDMTGEPLSLEDVQNIRFLIARIDEDELSGLPRYFNYFSTDVSGADYQFDGETRQPTLAAVAQPTFESGDGAFAEIVYVPEANLHVVPDHVSDEVAVFTEPLAAAY